MGHNRLIETTSNWCLINHHLQKWWYINSENQIRFFLCTEGKICSKSRLAERGGAIDSRWASDQNWSWSIINRLPITFQLVLLAYYITTYWNSWNFYFQTKNEISFTLFSITGKLYWESLLTQLRRMYTHFLRWLGNFLNHLEMSSLLLWAV